MTIDDSDEFRGVMKAISSLYRQPISDAFTHVWWDQFKGYSLIEFEGAVRAHIKDVEEGRFFPAPAHLFNHLQGNPRAKKKELLERIDLAWIDIKKGLKHFGNRHYRYLQDKQAQVAVLEIGGWKHLSSCNVSDLIIIKREFAVVYRRLEELTLNDLLERLPAEAGKTLSTASRTMSPAEQLATIQGIAKKHFS